MGINVFKETKRVNDVVESDANKTEKSDFNLCVSAKNGDSKANLQLWNRYKPCAISILKPVPGLTFEEKLSEAYMLLLHKLDYFDPKKVLEARDPDSFTFSYLMTGGLKNLRDKLFREFKRNTLNISWTPFRDEQKIDCIYKFTEYGTDSQERYCINDSHFKIFSPEAVLFRNSAEELNNKTKKLYEKMSELQRNILNLRGKGLTLQEVGKELQCSCSSVQYQLRKIKYNAARIFGNYPGLKITREVCFR
jgi:RNA polymerase sigma factor (sigma-70 family)